MGGSWYNIFRVLFWVWFSFFAFVNSLFARKGGMNSAFDMRVACRQELGVRVINVYPVFSSSRSILEKAPLNL